MRNKARKTSQNAPERSAGNIRLARLTAISGAHPDIEAEKEANKSHKHPNERA